MDEKAATILADAIRDCFGHDGNFDHSIRGLSDVLYGIKEFLPRLELYYVNTIDAIERLEKITLFLAETIAETRQKENCTSRKSRLEKLQT
jgi:hypothetical protein